MTTPKENLASPTGVSSIEQLFDADPDAVELTAEDGDWQEIVDYQIQKNSCLLYTSDAADDAPRV